jgi:hypothetical protein
MYTLEKVNEDKNWNAENYRWAKIDKYHRLGDWDSNGPRVGNSLILNFEYSELMGPFYTYMTPKISEIIESRRGFTHFKTEDGGEYKLAYRKL